ncbi:MAG: hypothetical protein ACP5JO_09490 [Candidatus Ratteibacteria bacterium]
MGKIEQLSDLPAEITCIEVVISSNVDHFPSVASHYEAVKKIDKKTENSWQIFLSGDDSVITDFIKFLIYSNVAIVEVKKFKEDVQTIFFKTGAKNVS